jgi:hypothetical protein
MGNPYAEAAKSYAYRIGALGRGRLIVLSILTLPCICFCFGDAAKGDATLPVILELVLSVLIAIHVRDQFSCLQSRLIPGFQKVHSAIACAFVAIVAVLVPAVFTLLAGWKSVGFIAFTVFLFGVVVWFVLLRLTQLLSFLFVILVLGEQHIDHYLDSFVSGQFEIEAVILFMAGLAIVAPAVRHLLRLRGESWASYDGKQAVYATRAGARGESSEDGRSLPLETRPRLGDRHTLALIRHAQRAAQSRLSRVCRWQAAMPRGWTTLLPTLGAIAYALMRGSIGRHKLEGSEAWKEFGFLSVILPALVLWSGCLARAAATCYEFSLPVTRQNYLKQLGAAAALSQLQSWAVMALVLTLWWLAVPPAAIPIAGLASVLIISFLAQFVLFGIGAFFSLPLFEKNSAVLVVFLFGLLSLLVAWTLMRPATEWQYGIIGLSLFLAFIGLVATWAAYRRWLVTDID